MSEGIEKIVLTCRKRLGGNLYVNAPFIPRVRMPELEAHLNDVFKRHLKRDEIIVLAKSDGVPDISSPHMQVMIMGRKKRRPEGIATIAAIPFSPTGFWESRTSRRDHGLRTQPRLFAGEKFPVETCADHFWVHKAQSNSSIEPENAARPIKNALTNCHIPPG